MRRLMVVIGVAMLAGGASVSFRTAAVKRGDLLITIGATGTVEPEEVVDVGAQVAGKIEAFGTAPDGSGKAIDYGSSVEEGTVLAQIDDALYQADVEQARAQLEQAKATVAVGDASVVPAEKAVVQAGGSRGGGGEEGAR
jgi:HlyD family secretion protein